MKSKTFADCLKAARERAQLTQAEVAARLGISQPSYARWETGACHLHEERLTAAAKALRTTLDELLGRRPVRRSA